MNIRSRACTVRVYLIVSLIGNAGIAGSATSVCEPEQPKLISKNFCGETPMTEKSKKSSSKVIEYKNRKIQISKPTAESAKAAKAEKVPQRIKIAIDDSEFEVIVEGGRFSSTLLPYGSYETPEALAKDVIDYVPAYKR